MADGEDFVATDSVGGDGGDGGRSVRIFQSRYSVLLSTVYKFFDRKDASENNFESPDDPICLSTYQLLIIAAAVITQDQEVAFERAASPAKFGTSF